MEFLAEILFEVYGELMFLIIPEKNRSKRDIWIAKIIAVTVFLAVIALAIWGMILLFECNNPWGVIPLAVAVVVSLTQIIAGILLFRKNH